jgi:hypothetical protein
MKKEIGVVGVDSGQILICDPCYIDSEWKKEEFDIKRRHRHIDGTILEYGKDFGSYEQPILKYGKTMNQINADNEAVDIPDDVPAENPFSYNACCKATCGKEGTGQLDYAMGHPGVGVVTSSGWGDGNYPVIADIDDRDGRVKSITVVFIDEEDEE